MKLCLHDHDNEIHFYFDAIDLHLLSLSFVAGELVSHYPSYKRHMLLIHRNHHHRLQHDQTQLNELPRSKLRGI